MNEERLYEIKEEIDNAKSEINKLEGRESNLLEDLQETFGCKNVKEAKQKADTLQTQIEELEDEIKQGMQKLEDSYDSIEE